MQPPVARGLGVSGDPELVEQRLELRRRAADIAEVRAGLGVEIEPQLVAVLGVRGAIGPDVEAEAPEVDRPDHVGEVGDDERA